MDILTALNHHQAGRIAAAVDIYQQILQADPNHPDALHLMGYAALQLGDAALAVSMITRATELAPDKAGYFNSLGMALSKLGRFDEALQCYARMLELEPGSASAEFGRGNVLLDQGRPAQAVLAFAAALQARPDFVEARYNLANAQKALGRYAEAAENYRRVTQQLPDLFDAWHNLGSVLAAQGQPEAALAAYGEALAGGLPETHYNLGNLLQQQGRSEAAAEHYRAALALRPDYAEAQHNYGTALRALGRDEAAAAAFAAAIRLQPGAAHSQLGLAEIELAAGRVDAAAAHYEAALAAAPTLAEAHFGLGLARVRQQRPEAARDCFAAALALRPEHADTRYNLAVVEGQLQHNDIAERLYREVLAQDPDHVAAHVNLSAILMAQERTEEGRQHIAAAYSRCNVFPRSSPTAQRTVLVLFDAGRGNANMSYLFDERANNLIDWMIEYAPPRQEAQLPPYDIVFNAMGDPDLTGGVIARVERFLEVCRRPLLNHPARVAATARDKLPQLLAGIEGIVVPPVWRFAGELDTAALAAELPLLLRPVHTQGGIGLRLARNVEELAQYRAAQPGPVYVARFVDFRSADGWYRKYRMFFIDRKPYPYHLAISPQWMVHYYSAGMEDQPWKLAEERAYLEAPEAALGAAAMTALRAIGERLDLDYAGIDFSLLEDGRLLVFEANSTMLVHPERDDGPLRHKNVHVNRILQAFEAHLAATLSRAGA